MADAETMLNRITGQPSTVIDLSLDRMKAALERLGNPQNNIPPAFHVAGTNGKGSTIAFLRAILEAAGKSVHVYTSPHLVRLNETIVLAGQEIEDDTLISILKPIGDSTGNNQLTHFEAMTCAAFIAFSKKPADYTIVEVGLGGREDATNVMEKPLATAVTPVDLDHQGVLGSTVDQIARQKAGIFKRLVPAVLSRQNPEAMGALQQQAQKIGARIYAFGEQWNIFSEHGRLIYQDDDGLCDLDPPRLMGNHQWENAGTAIAITRASGIAIDDNTISKGLAQATLPARMQRLTRGPLVDLVTELTGETADIWLDGGHNPHAAQAIASVMADLETRTPKPLIIIAGMQANKDAEGYFSAFTGLARKVFCVTAEHKGAMPAGNLVAAAQAAGLNAQPSSSMEDALRSACRETKNEPPRILIGGSLYLAGEVLGANA